MTFYDLLNKLNDNIDLYVVIEGNGRSGSVEDFKTINGFYDFIVINIDFDKQFNELDIFLKRAWQNKSFMI